MNLAEPKMKSQPSRRRSAHSRRTVMEKTDTGTMLGRAPGALKFATCLFFLFDVAGYAAPWIWDVLYAWAPDSIWTSKQGPYSKLGMITHSSGGLFLTMMAKLASIWSGSWSLQAGQCIGSGIVIADVACSIIWYNYSMDKLGFQRDYAWLPYVTAALYFLCMIYLVIAAAQSRRSLKKIAPNLHYLWKPWEADYAYVPHLYTFWFCIIQSLWILNLRSQVLPTDVDLEGIEGQVLSNLWYLDGLGWLFGSMAFVSMIVTDCVEAVYLGTYFLFAGFCALAFWATSWSHVVEAVGMDRTFFRFNFWAAGLGAILNIVAMYKHNKEYEDPEDGYQEM